MPVTRPTGLASLPQVFPEGGDWRRPLRWIALAAVALRLIYIFAADLPLAAVADAPGYDGWARNLVERGQFAADQRPSAERTPGYPLFVASIYALGGSYRTVTIVQALMDGGSLLLLGPIGAALGVAPVGILLAAAAAAVAPPLVQQSAFLMTESLYQLLLLAAVALTLHIRGPRLAMLAGALWGLNVLVRPTLAYFVIVLALWLLLRRSGRRVLIAAGLIAAFLITLSPWLIRNQRVLGAPVLSTFGYQNLYAFNSRLDQPDWRMSPLFLHSVQALCERAGWGPDAIRERTDVQVDSLCRAEAHRLIRENPGRFAALGAIRTARLWLNLGYGRPPSVQSWVLAASMTFLMALLLAGFIRRRGWRSWSVMALVLLFAYNTAVHAVSVAFFRFNQPLLPLFFLLVAWALWSSGRSPADEPEPPFKYRTATEPAPPARRS